MSGRTVTGRMLPSYCSERQEPIEEVPTLQENQRAALMGLARDLAVGSPHFFHKKNGKREKSGKCRSANSLSSSRNVQFIGFADSGRVDSIPQVV